ncbi:LuxR family transcriptional regulator [Arthrobacter cheniae]|uniref:LuxR family transcriptional regulator n=2 Tax=Arthrobacter cheniae TaxID=1258888 RepID=A0A3A5M2B0_9MICC|nr:LuxR family transcriptional regulator [Arthrobacter cheniae]
MSSYVTTSALVIFTEECTGRPRKQAGAEDIISRVSIAELDALRTAITDGKAFVGEAELAGRPRPVLALIHTSSGALLVLTDPYPTGQRHDAGMNHVGMDDVSMDDVGINVVSYLWRMAAQRIHEKVADAPPSFLLESRAASAERVRVTAELTDLHSTTLETLLAALRSPSLDDAAARSTVTDLTAKALIGIRTLSDRTTDLVEEPVGKAFERLRKDLRPFTRFSGIEIEFVEPPLNGRALPGEVAQAARAIVRGLVLAMMEQPDVSRVRIHWDCDGENLLINVRDDGRGTLAAGAPNISCLNRRVQALNGHLQIDVMAGWGADVFVTLPLNLPAPPAGDVTGWDLAARELEVLQHLVAGERNRTIASLLGISENTVKFHMRNLFKKLAVGSRTEAIALAHSHGLR